jgi:L-2-hydroxyglutarate oxidase LhgO
MGGTGAARLGGVRAHFARGRYFALAHRAPFSHLVYPVPEPGGLGVHLTLDLAGQARFGPDVQWMPEATDASPEAIAAFDYAVDPVLREHFAAEVRAYWPEVPIDALAPAYSGIRPKLSGPGDAAADFMIAGPEAHGIAGLVHLLGIESPGLTAALSIADDVAETLAPVACR